MTPAITHVSTDHSPLSLPVLQRRTGPPLRLFSPIWMTPHSESPFIGLISLMVSLLSLPTKCTLVFIFVLRTVSCLEGFYVTMTSSPLVRSSDVKYMSECQCLLLNKVTHSHATLSLPAPLTIWFILQTAQNYTFEGAYQKDKTALRKSYLKLTLLPDDDGPSVEFENPKQCHNVYMRPDRCNVCGQQCKYTS